MTYVANVNDVAFVATAGRMVGEVVGRNRGTVVSRRDSPNTAKATASTAVSAKATAVGEPATESAAAASTKSTTKSSSATDRTTKSASATTHSSSESTASTPSAGKAILSHFELTSLPVVSVELRNRVSGVLGRLKSDHTAALRTTIRSNVNICTNDGTYNAQSVWPRQNHFTKSAYQPGGRDP